MTKRVFRKRNQTPDQAAHEAAVREHFQRERPSLRHLLESGDGTEPMMQREYFELQVACRERLRPLREAAGLSLSDMATRTGMDRAALQKLESGVHANPTISTINRYLHALGKRLVVSIIDETTDPRVALRS
jgi:ribosome-binding protein aMBF1 (putative translation factor)